MPRFRLYRASFFLGLILPLPIMAQPVVAAPDGSSGLPPTVSPAADHRQELASWLTALGNRNPQVRSQSRQKLMSLTPAELPVLREVVAAAPHLTPAQADPLEAIITYVAARGSLLDQPVVGRAFMGVTVAPCPVEQMDDQDQAVEVGVSIADRLFGYVAYRYLSDGDIVLALGTHDELKPTRTPAEFMEAVGALRPGDTITLRLIRGGVLIRVQFPLDADPQVHAEHRSASSPTPLELSIDHVRSDAQSYYDRQFRPLIGPAIEPAT